LRNQKVFVILFEFVFEFVEFGLIY
jgi:hypothetical protein